MAVNAAQTGEFEIVLTSRVQGVCVMVATSFSGFGNNNACARFPATNPLQPVQ